MRWRRRLAMFLIVLFTITVGTTVFAKPAFADLCAGPPSPVSPKAGLPGLFTTVPADIPAAAPDPFKDPKIPIGDVYGYNWHWANYDLGCGSDLLKDPGAVTNTTSGNILFSLAAAGTAALDSLEHMARTSSLKWLTDPLHAIAQSLKGPILSLWFPATTLLLAVILVWRAKKASYHETAKTAGVFAAAVVLATFSLFYPTLFSTLVDKAVTTTADVTGTAFSASPIDAINRESAYRTWLTGNFGDPDSPSATKYGPDLLSSTNYTWSDWKHIQEDPDAKKAIDKAKAAKFQEIAHKLYDDDPSAYEYFTGRGERTGPALFGIVSVTAMGLFVGMAAIMILVARVMMQALTLIAPIVAVVGILPKSQHLLVSLWDLFAAAVVAVAKFTIAGGVMAIVLGAIQSADISGVGRLFFVVIATTVGIVVTKPLRSFKTLVPGLDPNTSYMKKLINHVGPALASGGAAAAVIKGMGDKEEQAEEPVRAAPAPSLDPLPVPTVTQVQPEPRPAKPPVEVAAAVNPAHALSAAPLPPSEIAAQSTAPRALPAAPLALTSAPAAADQDSEPSSPTASTPSTQSPSTAPTAPGLAPSPVPPEPSRAKPDVTQVVHPTGVYAQIDPSQYHPGAPREEYLTPATELELGEDGTEHERIVYHPKGSEA